MWNLGWHIGIMLKAFQVGLKDNIDLTWTLDHEEPHRNMDESFDNKR